MLMLMLILMLMLMLMLTPPRRSSGSDSGMGGEGGLSESELLESTNAPLTYFGELYYHLCLHVDVNANTEDVSYFQGHD